MERIVRQLRAFRAKELRAFLKLSNLTDVNLSKDEENALNLLSGSLNWQPFNLKDLFGAATRGKTFKKAQTEFQAASPLLPLVKQIQAFRFYR